MRHLISNLPATRQELETDVPATMQDLAANVPTAPQEIVGAPKITAVDLPTVSKKRRTAIPKALCHQVWLRDQGRCTHKLGAGGLCGSRHRIEIDHQVPWAKGGPHTLDNLALKCRPHNQLAAEQAFGKEFMGRYRKHSEADSREGSKFRFPAGDVRME